MVQLSLLSLIEKPASLELGEASTSLEEIFLRLNRHYFQDRVRARIRWGRYGRRHRRPRRRTIRLGAYFFEHQTIRIHPVLAQQWVPREVLESVIHHEMCHAAAPSQHHLKKRRCHHHEEFRTMERSFEHYEQAERWIKENLERLLKHKETR